VGGVVRIVKTMCGEIWWNSEEDVWGELVELWRGFFGGKFGGIVNSIFGEIW